MRPAHAIDLSARRRLLIVRLTGEIDSAAMPDLRAALASASRLSPPTLSLDFTATTYVGLSALGALLVARATAMSADVDVLTPGAPGSFRRLTESTSWTGLIGRPADPAARS
ncbi:STAS domain-containing protein [Modestobacter versicolor]|uniref:STAS domain-containing protein n=1 Tax=Modestobacter versicolor TaxID=429133 RepID=UPI0034DE8AA6